MNDLIAINQELARLCKALATAVTEYGEAAKFAAEARTAYDVMWAQAMLATPDDATQRVKEAMATKVCSVPMLEARVAEANRDTLKERIKALEAVLSVQQSRLRHLEYSETHDNLT